MSAQRYQLEADPHAGGAIYVRVDDDYPAWERPITMRLVSGYRDLTADEAQALGEALIAVAAEGRAHQSESRVVVSKAVAFLDRKGQTP